MPSRFTLANFFAAILASTIWIEAEADDVIKLELGRIHGQSTAASKFHNPIYLSTFLVGLTWT